jgi:hypothetical protein
LGCRLRLPPPPCAVLPISCSLLDFACRVRPPPFQQPNHHIHPILTRFHPVWKQAICSIPPRCNLPRKTRRNAWLRPAIEWGGLDFKAFVCASASARARCQPRETNVFVSGGGLLLQHGAACSCETGPVGLFCVWCHALKRHGVVTQHTSACIVCKSLT